MNIIFPVVIFIFLICTKTFAGVIITTEDKKLSAAPPRIETSKIYIEGKKMRIETGLSGRGSNDVMIYRGDQNLILNINHQRKSYMVMDKQAMKDMAQQMSQMMKQMEERMAQMPPEQRKTMEEVMGRGMPQAPQPPPQAETEIKNTGKKDKINGYRCTWYDVSRAGQKKQEMCVSDLKEIGIKKETFEVFKDMAKFFKELMASIQTGPMSRRHENPFMEFEKLDGFPVLMRNFQGSTVSMETIFKSAEHKKIDKALFEAPPGYTREKGFGRHN